MVEYKAVYYSKFERSFQMKKFRFISAILAASVLFSATAFADFSDMPEEAGLKTAIENAVSNGLLSGYEDGTVRPDANITRAEMASIITRACGVDGEADISDFSDVPADKWYHSAFAKAYKMGAFSGDDQKLMHPENNITFQECFTILSQVFDLLPEYTIANGAVDDLPENKIYVGGKTPRVYDVSVLGSYTDNADIAAWAKVFYAGVVANGGWTGENGYLTPTAYITRGQFAIVMNNLIQNYIDTPGTYTELPAGNTIIRGDGVVLESVVSDKSLYIADCVSPFGITFTETASEEGESAKKTSIARLVVRGCATEVDEEGNPVNDDYGISPVGAFGTIRILCPYISANLSGCSYKGLYTAPKTSVVLGIIQQ